MEDRFEAQIREALQTHVGTLFAAEGAPSDLSVRVWRRRLRTASVLLTAALVAVASAAVVPTLIDRLKPATAAAGDPAVLNRPVAPENHQVVASGQADGRSWKLYAYATDHSATGEGVTGDHCEAFRFGSQTPGEDYGCDVGGNAPLTPPQFIAPTWLTPEHGPEVFFGRVAPEAERIKVAVTGGPTIPASTYPGPAEWATGYDFFVGFAPRGSEEVTLIVEDAAGNELERRTLEGYPSE